MKITFLNMGKPNEGYLREGIAMYSSRLKHYTQFEVVDLELPAKLQKLPPVELMKKEAELQLKWMEKADFTVLLDENGKMLSSVDFAGFIGQRAVQSVRHLVFVAGGSWGFDMAVHKKAHWKQSLSPMTFPHQLVRIIFLEQLYRAFTILRNEPYHNP